MKSSWIRLAFAATVALADVGHATAALQSIDVVNDSDQPFEVTAQEILGGTGGIKLELKLGPGFPGMYDFASLHNPFGFSLLSLSFGFEGAWVSQFPVQAANIISASQIVDDATFEFIDNSASSQTVGFNRNPQHLASTVNLVAGNTLLSIDLPAPSAAAKLFLNKVVMGSLEVKFDSTLDVDGNEIQRPLATLTVTPVPEPGTVVLVGAGLVMLLLVAGRGRRMV